MIPSQPTFIDRPFAQNGNRNTIPTTNNGTEGKASYSLGFPPITEKPIVSGGVPPFRKDFNGILYALSAFAFYAQSGGVFTYNADYNYVPRCIVNYSNVLYICIAQNGVDSTNGVKTPGTNPSYWVRLIDWLLDQATKDILSVPIGTIIMWASANNPVDGGVWLDCNGQSYNTTTYATLYQVLGSANVPDLRGMFPRCNGSQSMNVTINGETSSQTFDGGTVGDKSPDAIRNITGEVSLSVWYAAVAQGAKGAFYYEAGHGSAPCCNGSDGRPNALFDTSKVVPVASENKPVSATLRFLIKAK